MRRKIAAPGLESLRWIVECQADSRIGGYEAIAAFNVAGVAERYAVDCKRANPRNEYRVVELPEARVVSAFVTFRA